MPEIKRRRASNIPTACPQWAWAARLPCCRDCESLMGGNGRLPYNRARASSRAERALTKLDCKKLPAAKLTLTADRFGSTAVYRRWRVNPEDSWTPTLRASSSIAIGVLP
jgi:hypothetical protein